MSFAGFYTEDKPKVRPLDMQSSALSQSGNILIKCVSLGNIIMKIAESCIAVDKEVLNLLRYKK